MSTVDSFEQFAKQVQTARVSSFADLLSDYELAYLLAYGGSGGSEVKVHGGNVSKPTEAIAEDDRRARARDACAKANHAFDQFIAASVALADVTGGRRRLHLRVGYRKDPEREISEAEQAESVRLADARARNGRRWGPP